MTVIRCETCKGTGKTQEYKTIITNCMSELDIQIDVTCRACGGSGCKWLEVNK